jgi:cytochrome c oxidase assembly protein subunit 15
MRQETGRAQVTGRWLALWAVTLFLLFLVGGATRLTESGLSITEWKPVTGILPPLGDAAWQDEFAKYQRIPQYARMNAGMTLASFKAIYLWEFAHRLWARLVGVVFAVPLLWFVARGTVPRPLRPRLFVLLLLMGAQGAMGWYMVKSGLTERVNVSQYRLAAHLALALVIYLLAVWTAADLLSPRDADAAARPPQIRQALASLTALAFGTVISGAFVAGLRAGKIYNTFPMMGGRWMPAEYGSLAPWWRNLFENPSAVQFNHRMLAYATFCGAVAAWWWLRRSPDARLVGRTRLVLGAALLQVGLGITTLLLAVPVPLGVAHQAGAIVLLTTLVLALHAASANAER